MNGNLLFPAEEKLWNSFTSTSIMHWSAKIGIQKKMTDLFFETGTVKSPIWWGSNNAIVWDTFWVESNNVPLLKALYETLVSGFVQFSRAG